jgi:hypothetical protein
MHSCVGKTGPILAVWVFRGVKSIAMVRVWVEPDPESTWEYGTDANTCQNLKLLSGVT